MGRCALVLSLFIASLMLVGCDSKEVSNVKGKTFPVYDSTTIEKVLSANFDSVVWSSGTTEIGENYVTATGKINRELNEFVVKLRSPSGKIDIVSKSQQGELGTWATNRHKLYDAFERSSIYSRELKQKVDSIGFDDANQYEVFLQIVDSMKKEVSDYFSEKWGVGQEVVFKWLVKPDGSVKYISCTSKPWGNDTPSTNIFPYMFRDVLTTVNMNLNKGKP